MAEGWFRSDCRAVASDDRIGRFIAAGVKGQDQQSVAARCDRVRCILGAPSAASRPPVLPR